MTRGADKAHEGRQADRLRRARRLGRRKRTRRVRRWGAAGLLIAFVAALLGYRALTDRARLQRLTQAYLQQFFVTPVSVAEVSFSLTRGIELSDVTVVDPLTGLEGPPLLSFEAVWLRHDPLELLLGRFEVDEVVATRPVCRARYNDAVGQFNIQQVLRAGSSTGARDLPPLPEVRIQQAQLLVYADASAGALPVEEITLAVTAQPDAVGRHYDVAWMAQTDRRSDGRFVVDLRRGVIEDRGGGAPWLSLSAASLMIEAIEPRARWWIDALGVSGRFRIVDYAIGLRPDTASSNRLAIEFDDARLSIPVEASEDELPPDERFVRLDEVDGRVVIDRQGAKADVVGTLGGATCQLRGQMRGDVSRQMRFGDLGFDVDVEISGVTLPQTGSEAPAREKRFINRWTRLRHFYRDFDPQGQADVVASLSKLPGAGARIELRHALVRARGGEVSMRYFPYRITGVEGELELTSDGVFINGLTGHHGEGEISAQGWLSAMRRTSAAELVFRGRNVPLDGELCSAIGGRHRRTWERFTPRGHAHLVVYMSRPASEEVAPWSIDIDAELLSVDAEFDGFPYPLRDLHGQVGVHGDTFDVAGVRGRCGAGALHADGTVRTSSEGLEQLDLHLRADAVPLDDALLAALPADGRRAVASLAATGVAAMDVRLTDVGGEVTYDITARLEDVCVEPDDFPLPVESLTGDVLIQPARVTLKDLAGEASGGVVRMSGQIARDGTDATSVEMRGERILLTEALRAALPERVRAQLAPWQIEGPFNVEGWIGGAPPEHRVRLGLDDATICYAPFALPWRITGGQVVVAEERVRFCDVRAVRGPAELALSGEVDGAGGDMRIALAGLELDEDVRTALPWRWRRRWNDLAPRGALDVRHGVLNWVRAYPESETNWRLAGQVHLNDVDLATVLPLRGASGRIDLAGEARGSLAEVFLKGDIRLDRLMVGEHVLTDVSGRLLRDGLGERLRFDELHARMYDGTVSGEVNIEADGGASRYAIEATVQRAQVHGLVDARSGHVEAVGPAEALAPLSGHVDGRFYLTGVTGESAQRRGGGRIQVRDAELYRLPLLLSVLHVINLSIPENSAFQSGSAQLTIVGDELRLGNIELIGGALVLIGQGSMALSTGALDLQLVAVSPHRWARMPVVSEMLEGMARELVEVHVTGTLQEPKAVARPLRNVEAVLDALLTLREIPTEERQAVAPGP